LTFQEYLAAWHLSNQELEKALQLIQQHIRRQKWFEVLQLLGGEWAKQSDEKLDRYLGWLLDQQGTTIAERAPVIALCANIVKDAAGVAELKQQTRQAYQSAIRDTLAAFRQRSGVPDKIQLEILEALGQLGAAVKLHLIDATKSGLYAVRRRAIEILLPHLSDDELFDLEHIMADRSKEPIKTFLRALLERDIERTTAWLLQRNGFQQKVIEAVGDLVYYLDSRLTSDVRLNILSLIFLLTSDVRLNILSLIFLKGTDNWARRRFLTILAIEFREEIQIWRLIREAAISDHDAWHVRPQALKLLA
jgi:hypothetical protein